MEGVLKMSNVKWTRISPVIEVQDQVEKFEQDYNVILPSDFKSFVYENNYGTPTPDSISVSGFGDTDVKRLLSYISNDTETVYQVIKYFIPNKLIPFAADSYGNYFCFHGDKVVFWDHETDEQYDMGCTFTGFLQMIH